MLTCRRSQRSSGLFGQWETIRRNTLWARGESCVPNVKQLRERLVSLNTGRSISTCTMRGAELHEPYSKGSPMPFCQSYLAGNFREVWDELNGMGSVLFEDDLLVADAKCVVAETMLRVKSNIETIVGRLRKLNYGFMVEMMATAFGPPLGTESQSPYAPPDPDVESILEQFEQSVGPIPLALRGWFESVGSVNLIGLHPTLSPRDASILTDPLAVMSPREIASELSGAPVGSMRLPMFHPREA